MFILAIDTALDYCAAAVLDTNTQAVIAQETQAMKRGHAEALMPLIARVMTDSGIAYLDLDRIAVTYRAWQFHWTAGWPLSRSRHRTGRGQARGGTDDAVRLRRSTGRRRPRNRRSSQRSMRATTTFIFRLLPATARR